MFPCKLCQIHVACAQGWGTSGSARAWRPPHCPPSRRNRWPPGSATKWLHVPAPIHFCLHPAFLNLATPLRPTGVVAAAPHQSSMASFADAPAGDTAVGEKIFKTKASSGAATDCFLGPLTARWGGGGSRVCKRALGRDQAGTRRSLQPGPNKPPTRYTRLLFAHSAPSATRSRRAPATSR